MQKNLSAAVVVASIDLAIGSSLGYLLPYHRLSQAPPLTTERRSKVPLAQRRMEWTSQAMHPIFFGLLPGPSLLVECGPFPHARAGRVLDER